MRHHVQKVLDGEYEVPYEAILPVILDIGANVGSFAAWALKRWPGCHVHCYEPLPDNFVAAQEIEQSRVTRGPVEASAQGDIVKIDILSRMTSFDFDVIMLEYHSEANRRKIEELLRDFFLVGGEIRGLHRGTLKYFHQRLIQAAGLLVPRHVG